LCFTEWDFGSHESDLMRLFRPIPNLPSDIYLLIHDDMKGTPRVRALYDLIIGELAAVRLILDIGRDHKGDGHIGKGELPSLNVSCARKKIGCNCHSLPSSSRASPSVENIGRLVATMAMAGIGTSS
jgi:hypothetical protein